MRYLLIIWLIIFSGRALAQIEDLLEETIDQASLFSGEDELNPEFADQWREQFQNPIKINSVTYEELLQFPWVSPTQARSLITYRMLNGEFIDLYELQAVPGWDLHTVRMMAPLIIIKETNLNADPRELKRRVHDLQNSYLLIRFKRTLETASQHGQPANFRGSPEGLLSRLRLKKPSDFSIGITAEKDPGEPLAWNSHSFGADFWSFHVAMEHKGNFRKVILGDFLGHWDQGLIFSSGFSLGRQVITGIKRAHSGFLPYSSVTENGFYRGLAIEYDIKKLRLSVFLSRNLEDANVLPPDSSIYTGPYFTSFINQGLHRNTQELSRKNQVKNQLAGINMRTQINRGPTVSLSALHQQLNLPLIPSRRRYNTFYFTGEKNYNYSLAVEQTIYNIHFFAQWAVSASGGHGYVAGLLSSISPNINTSLKWRSLQKDFHSISGNPVGISNRNSNENGLYWGMEWLAGPRWKCSGYLDIYRFPWASFRADQPANGMESMARLQYMPDKTSHVDIQWRTNFKQINQPILWTNTSHLSDLKRQQVALKAKWTLIPWVFKSRFQWSKVKQFENVTRGFLLSQEIIFDHSNFQVTLSATLFSTDDFDNRQYIYERDLLYSFSFPFYQGTGTRWYVLSKLKITPKLHGWLRISRTILTDIVSYSSGLNTIEGNTKMDLKIQLLYKL